MPRPDPQPEKKSTARRARSWQAERREETRSRLLDAAAKTFGELGYVGTRVEDILAQAQVARTTFYKQFRDRLDIVSELFTAFMPEMTEDYLSICEAPLPDPSCVSGWIDRLVAAYARRSGVMRLFAEVTAIEPGFSATISHVQVGIIEGLGVRFPAFRTAAKSGNGEVHTRAILVLETIDHVCTMLSLRNAAIERDVAVRFAAKIFLDFVETDG